MVWQALRSSGGAQDGESEKEPSAAAPDQATLQGRPVRCFGWRPRGLTFVGLTLTGNSPQRVSLATDSSSPMCGQLRSLNQDFPSKDRLRDASGVLSGVLGTQE